MSLQRGTPNPLNFFNLRRVNFPASHFEYIVLEDNSLMFVKKINNWIFNTLNSRYYIGNYIALDNTNTIVYKVNVGFESAKELSFFIMACPHLQK